MPNSNAGDHWSLKLAGTVLLLVLAVVYALSSGASELPLAQIFSAQLDPSLQMIFWEIRLPRILVAALCGAALAAAGVISQGLFRNPLAGPSIIGTTGGANVCVVTVMYFGWSDEHWFIQPSIAFLGALASTFVVLKLMRWRFFAGGERILLLGFSLNAIYAAITSFILSMSLSQYGLSQSIMYWLLGGINGKGWVHLWMALPWLVLGLAMARSLSRQLDVLNLGEEIASSLSVSVPRLRKLSIICLSILVGASVAVSGAIGFVGLIVPHFSRLYVGAQHTRLLPISILNGMSLLIVADTLARTLWAPQELQVGALISLIGAPVFILLLILQSRRASL